MVCILIINVTHNITQVFMIVCTSKSIGIVAGLVQHKCDIDFDTLHPVYKGKLHKSSTVGQLVTPFHCVATLFPVKVYTLNFLTNH